MAYQTASLDEVDPLLDDDVGDLWFLKDALGTEHVAVSVFDLAPGATGTEHSHEEQEEVYLVVDGGIEVELEDETVALGEGEAVRVDPDTSRLLVNGDERSRIVVVGAPRDAE